MTKFLTWLADSPLATAAKVGLAATLAYTLVNPDILNLPPVVAVGVAAAIPVIIDWINPQDVRYGRGK